MPRDRRGLLVSAAVSRAVGVVSVTVLALLSAAVVAPPGKAAETNSCKAGGCPSQGYAGEGSISVVVTGTGVRTSSGPTTTRTVSVQPRCWYQAYMTGAEYFAAWEPGGPLHENARLYGGSFKQFTVPHEGHDAYKDDAEGRWFTYSCDHAPRAGEEWSDASREINALQDAHENAIFVPAGAEPPMPEVSVEVLRDVAADEMTLPDPVVGWNPRSETNDATVVGIDTWVWLEDPVTELYVTATAGTNSATVTASFETMTLSAPDTPPTTCTSPGTPWTDGARSDCTIAFARSSANRPTRTTPLTITTGWATSWTANGTDQGPLDTQTTTGQADIPVAEIQTIVQ
ncbi:hypothetical protein [Sanguibacter suaedae]|uniref:Uncharacterized protein n=1 Tax=Sanguibacter suaedae TaxID=2795737 RepID=A0A934M6R8_9MICO|nr:hypothetical protein [Sanguibacter suaedae]MBI9114552.1 hypothetical protein [Sanguibacter suaedae]